MIVSPASPSTRPSASVYPSNSSESMSNDARKDTGKDECKAINTDETDLIMPQLINLKSLNDDPTGKTLDGEQLDRPPRLQYDMKRRKRSLAINIFFIVFFNVAVTNVIFYVLLVYDDNHNHGDNGILYGAMTATLGVLQLPQFAHRWWQCSRNNDLPPKVADPIEKERLLQKGTATLRGRFLRVFTIWDAFQFCFLIGIILGTAMLVLGTSINGTEGSFILVALFPPTLFAAVGVFFILFNIAHALQLRTPFPLSERPKGEPFRPCVAYVWSDFVAVDGGGKLEARKSFTARYDASPPFRTMLRKISWMIGFGFVFQLIPEVIFLTMVEDRAVAYGPSWAILLFVLLAQCAFAYIYVQRSFVHELRWWKENRASAP